MEHIKFPMRRSHMEEVVSSHQRKIIVDAYNYKLAQNPDAKIVHLKNTLSKELGMKKSAIYQTILQYKWSNKVLSPKRTKQFKSIKINKVNNFQINLIKRKVYQFWFDREFPTLNKILRVVNEDEDLPYFSRTSLYVLLKSIDFQYVKQGCKRAMVEKTRIVLRRREYLRQIRQYREEGRPIYYLAVTRTVISYGNKTFPLIFNFHIGSEDGFVPDSLFSFESKKNTHENTNTQMDGECFREWLENVLPKLKDRAVIIMKDASYCSMKQDSKCPTINSRKADIIAWLERKGEVVDTSMMIPELLEIVNRLMPMHDKYVLDEIVKAHNKYVLRLPPHHRELNPMKLVLSKVKSYVRMNRKTLKLHELNKLLTESVQNTDLWKHYTKHVVGEEKKLWDMDYVVDELMSEREPCFSDVASDDSGSE